MGKQLARLHKIEQPFFGWTLDNCIGSTLNLTLRSEKWIEFYRVHRLQHQFQLAARKGQSFDKAEKLILHLESFFKDYTPTLPCSMEISGGATQAMTRQVILLFLTLPVTTVIGKQMWLSLTCLGDSVHLFLRRL